MQDYSFKVLFKYVWRFNKTYKSEIISDKNQNVFHFKIRKLFQSISKLKWVRTEKPVEDEERVEELAQEFIVVRLPKPAPLLK